MTEYAERVVAGDIVAGPHVRGACARHLADLKREDLTWSVESALRAINFFPAVLRLAGGEHEGNPFELLDWQQFIVGSLFGWFWADGSGHPRAGYRRFTRAYSETAKGSGKSPLAAGIGMIGLVGDAEARPEIYAAASKKDQAMILFRDAVAMRQQSPALRKRLITSGGNPIWQLTDMKSGGWFKPIASDDSQSGPRPHFALVDELHEHKNRTVLEQLERGFKGRRQPLLFMITNSGFDRTSVCWEEHQHGVSICAGEIQDDSTFAYICSHDEGDDPLEDPSCWMKTNPSLGVTIREDYLQAAVSMAKSIPGRLNQILRLNFCVWTDAETAAISRAAWEACEADIDPLDYEEEDCYVGLDLSSTTDLTALTYSFKRDEEVHAFTEFWTPKDTMRARSLRDRVPYDSWIAQGWMHAPVGDYVHLAFVAHRLVELSSVYRIRGVLYDKHLIRQFQQELSAITGGDSIPLYEHPQGWNQRPETKLWMPESIANLEKLIFDRKLKHQRNPVMRWNIASIVYNISPAGLKRFDKQKSTSRIDGGVSLAMSAAGWTTGVLANEGSYVKRRGLVII